MGKLFNSHCLVVICIALFIINGVFLANQERPILGFTSHPVEVNHDIHRKFTIMAYNIAKGFIHKGGIKFENRNILLERLRGIAEIIKKEKADVVFISEIIFECGPCPINQVIFLAEEAGMHTWAFGENYNFGLPFYRIVGGNAILSRWPLKLLGNPSLSGHKPFYMTTNSRRVLLSLLKLDNQLKVDNKQILLAAVHNDSFSLDNNLLQTKQILDYTDKKEAIIAGDFNANPHEPSIQLIQNTGRFTGEFDGAMTFPSNKPNQKIDFIFVPLDWKLISFYTIQTNLSDHLPIVSIFKINKIGDRKKE